jgi:hypothetical protein
VDNGELLAALLLVALVAAIGVAIVVGILNALGWLVRGLLGTWRAFWAEPPRE